MTDANVFESTPKHASFHNWPYASPSPAIIVSKGFTYTGKEGIVECKSCKVEIDINLKTIISLADAHGNGCRIKSSLKDNSEISAHNVAGNVEEQTNNQNNNISTLFNNDDAVIDRNNTVEQTASEKSDHASFNNDNAYIERNNTVEHTAQDKLEHNCGETNSVDSTNMTRSFMPPLPSGTEPEPRIPSIMMELNDRIHSDLSVYDNYPSIKFAPCWCCPCRLLRYNNTIPVFCKRKKTDMYGFPKMDGRTLMLSLRERVSSGPLHPEFNTFEARERNLNGIIDSYSCIAEAGFFADSSCGKERICCFYCDGNLRNQLLSYNPWREHTRWFPVCPFILQQKGEEYIHNVLEDTKILKTYLEDKRRTSFMDTNVVVEALQVYPQYAIGKVMEKFFIENGYFPCREDLFESLDNIQLWKTSETYDYCRFEN